MGRQHKKRADRQGQFCKKVITNRCLPKTRGYEGIEDEIRTWVKGKGGKPLEKEKVGRGWRGKGGEVDFSFKENRLPTSFRMVRQRATETRGGQT